MKQSISAAGGAGVGAAGVVPSLKPDAVVDDISRWLSRVDQRRLPNGLTVCVLPDHRAPLVASAIAYRAGTRDEAPGRGGTAHFLEHMMFKGSDRYGPGDIDRLTQAAGGVNNAYTSHDVTLYYFTFAADRWQLALDIEADRLASLRLDSSEVDAERQVIHEEIAMYEGEPWDMLMQEVQTAFFGPHPYGKPVLGSRGELDGLDGEALRAFHRDFYRPDNAILIVAGDVEADRAHHEVARRFEAFEASSRPRPVAESARLVESRVERRHGELQRLEIAAPSPTADDVDYAVFRLLLGVLTLGRTSRLHRKLVDDEQHCLWVSADVQETLDPGIASVTAELVPGGDARAVEAAILGELASLCESPPSVEEIARVRQVMVADWLFAHERMEQRAFLIAGAAALVDLEHPARLLRRLLAASAEDLLHVARRFFAPGGLVIGWSLPEGEDR